MNSNLTIPHSAIIYNLDGDYIYPSFIDLYSNYGLSKPNTPLYGTGKMTQGTFVKERRKNKATIAVPRDREEILSYHQEGAGHLPKRDWFGISKKHQKKIEKIARIQFKKLLKTL